MIREGDRVTVDCGRGRYAEGEAIQRRRVMGEVMWDVLVFKADYDYIVRAPEHRVRPLRQEALV